MGYIACMCSHYAGRAALLQVVGSPMSKDLLTALVKSFLGVVGGLPSAAQQGMRREHE